MYVKIWTPWRVDIANDRYKFVNAQLWDIVKAWMRCAYAVHSKDAQPFANVEIGKTPNYLLMRKVCDEYIFVTRIPFVNQMVYIAFRFVIVHHSFQTYQETKFKLLNKYSSTTFRNKMYLLENRNNITNNSKPKLL